MAKVKVCRVIILEGTPDWVRATLDNSWLQPEVPFTCVNGTMTEVARLREIVEDTPETSEVARG